MRKLRLYSIPFFALGALACSSEVTGSQTPEKPSTVNSDESETSASVSPSTDLGAASETVSPPATTTAPSTNGDNSASDVPPSLSPSAGEAAPTTAPPPAVSPANTDSPSNTDVAPDVGENVSPDVAPIVAPMVTPTPTSSTLEPTPSVTPAPSDTTGLVEPSAPVDSSVVAPGNVAPLAGTPSEGCSLADVQTGSDLDRTLMVDTRERTYRLSVPTDYTPGEPLPLVFALNGVGGDGKGAQAAFRLETNRAIYVYPDSIHKESSGTVDWEYGGNGYDVDFFDALVSELTANYCVDVDRIFALGVSAGGIMANMLGCFRGDVLRGIAPASAMTWNNSCKGSVAVMVFCGEQDSFNPCDTDAKGETDFWTKENGCQAQTSPSPVADICESFEGCSADPVLICQHSGGHMWPNGGADMMWDFFMGL